MSRGFLAAAICVLAVVAVSFTAPSANAKRMTVGVNVGPGLGPTSGLTRIGPMSAHFFSNRPSQVRRWTLAFAIRTFGRPSAWRGTGQDCVARWKRLGLRLFFFSMQNRFGCRPTSKTHVLGASFIGRRARGRFVTDEGLRVGDPVRRMRALYDRARFVDGRWQLEFSRYCFGTGCPVSPSLFARVRNGRVVMLEAVTMTR